MNSELFLKVIQREERADRIKAFLVFPVAAFHLAIMSGRVRTDQLQFRCGMRIRMAMRTAGLTGQGFYASIPASPPEIDISPVLVV